MKITFITGNQGKADFLAKHIEYPIAHQKIDLDEIQSLKLADIAEHKAKQAYQVLNSPVLVEDIGLIFEGLGELPGPFIKWFEVALGLEKICELVDGFESRRATVKICYAFYDGKKISFFEGEIKGSIADRPRGDGGFGFDPIFIPDHVAKTLAEMDEEEVKRYSLRTTTVYPKIKEFLVDKA